MSTLIRDRIEHSDEAVVFGDGMGSGLFSGKGAEETGYVRGKGRESRFRNQKVKQGDLILFTTQLSVMLESGVVLSDALEGISSQFEVGSLQQIIKRVQEDVKSGETFSRALSRYPRAFNTMFLSMVRASEASGKMSDMLKVLSGYLDFEAETRKQVKSALTYPFIMAIMAVASTGTLMFFVLPRFTGIYESRGAALPGLTQVLVNFSQFMGKTENLMGVVTGLFLLIMFFGWWGRTEGGRRVIDYVKIGTPVIGTMFIDMVITRSMRILTTMIGTGVSLLDCLEVIEGACDNYYFRRLWRTVGEKIKEGYQLSDAIKGCPEGKLISPGVIQMLKAGEKSGRICQVSDKISTFYEKKLGGSIKSVMTVIEPLMITIMGGVIGTIAIALLLPVFKVSTVISH